MRTHYPTSIAAALLVVGICGTPPVSAQPAARGADTPIATPSDEDLARAPISTAASGIAEGPPPSLADHLIWIPRVVLFVPRWGFWLAAQPFRLAVWAYGKYQGGGGVANVDDAFSVTPTASIGGGFGPQIGARLVHRDLFGERERLTLGASFGGELGQGYRLELASGDRLGERLRIGLDTRYQRRPNDRFYGIGNGDQVDPAAMPLIDPTMDPTAVDTRFREERAVATVTADVKATSQLGLRLSGALMTRSFGTDPDDPRAIDMHYDRSRLVGFDTGLRNVYVEAELRYDSLRPTSAYQSAAMDATGWLASVYLGGKTGLADDRSDFHRYGVELQRYFDLHAGSRVLALRVLVESVGGTDGGADGEIAFVDLPTLGGLDDLRGYPTGRFRDRALTLASAEYTWDVGNYVAAFMFVDAGRVWHSLEDVELDGIRVGYGAGIQLHTRKSFVARAQVAASREGEVFFRIALSPAFGRRERAGRQ
jgi:hypothetical protein